MLLTRSPVQLWKKGGMVLALGLAVLSAQAASAATVTCSLGWSIGPSGECRDGIGANVSTDVLNTNSFFGQTDWEFLQKDDGALSTSFNVGLNVTDGNGATGIQATSGDWSFGITPWDDYSMVLVVLKDGVVAGSDFQWCAFLLDDGATSGTWALGGTQLSGFSVYGTPGTPPPPPPVPEPGTMILLGSGLLGLAGYGRKRAK